MPIQAGHPCAAQGCVEVVRRGERWCVAHRKQRQQRQDSERGSAAERGYDARWRRIRARYLRQHPLCVECQRLGWTTPATDVDHITPRSQGGTDDERNLQALCHQHHSAKTMRELKGKHRG